jgi:hypothetical protein
VSVDLVNGKIILSLEQIRHVLIPRDKGRLAKTATGLTFLSTEKRKRRTGVLVYQALKDWDKLIVLI